jgi:hypothetical protein
LASQTFADVQNIRLSGDIRIRGYYLNGEDGPVVAGVLPDHNDLEASFISQRTRVSVEADLEDHVLVVVTLQAEGTWGSDNATSGSSGAGTGSGISSDAISRRWDLGVAEAYVQFNELFYTPATLKLGRQYLHYGRGLILSSTEQEYNYDAARLVLDYYPLTIDLVGAELVNNQAFGGASSHLGANDLLFVNARYELSDSAIKDVEMYLGWVSQSPSGPGGAGTGPFATGRVPPTAGDSSPLIVGLRSDMNLTEGLQTWIEGAYEFGADGPANGDTISAFLLNLGGRYTFKNVQWAPVFNANYTFASGGGKGNTDSSFRPWFDYVDGYNGYVFMPALSDIHIFNLGASVKPYENTTLSLQAYYYYKADADGFAGSNPNVDWGGSTWSTLPAGVASGRDLGAELDGILGYDYSKDVRFQLVYGVFIPGGAYADFGVSRCVNEVRGEVNVKF